MAGLLKQERKETKKKKKKKKVFGRLLFLGARQVGR